jgi:hypothetical protein
MSRSIARILLAILLWPLAALVYMIVFFVVLEGLHHVGYYVDRATYSSAVAGCVTWGFIGGYWVMLWRGGVRWTARRRGMTLLAVIGSIGVAAVVGAVMGGVVEREFGWFIASVTAPLLWVVATVLAWRESSDERAARLANSGRDAVVCPTCGYNLTGLREARCPECGTQFTIDQLLASQPAGAAAGTELEG